jgi:hypothetical protein
VAPGQVKTPALPATPDVTLPPGQLKKDDPYRTPPGQAKKN